MGDLNVARNIGDEAWVFLVDGTEVTLVERKVKEVRCDSIKNKVDYYVEGIDYAFPEKDVFDSEEEAVNNCRYFQLSF